MHPVPLRLHPGNDLRLALQAALVAHGARAAFVLSAVGSLDAARIRLAGADEATGIEGDVEILSLSGTIAENGVHLHIAVATADGRVIGGHVAAGCIVRTTAEVLLALLPEWRFTREHDPATGYAELEIRPIGG
jgi:predicted DNA-binding protein with PD1-like motif